MPIFTNARQILLLAGLGSLAVVAIPQPSQSQELELITDQNRRDLVEPGEVQGGWGPHLRSILRSPGGDLWFVHDVGSDVDRNGGLRYKRRIDGRWIDAGSIDFTTPGGRVQQNLAHLLIGTTIYSYGIDVDRRRLVECTFNTLSSEDKRCIDVVVDGKALLLEPKSNYVGAALSPDGYRLIWWSSVSHGNRPGRLFHLWRFGAGWNGPVGTETRLAGERFDNIGYIRSAFSGRNRIEMLGELEKDPKNPIKRAVHVSIDIGPELPLAKISAVGKAARTNTAQDLWIDGRGGVHAITTATDPANSGFYFYKPPGADWRFIKAFPGLTVARFQEDPSSAMLHLLADRAGQVILRSGAVGGHSGPLDFDSFDSSIIHAPDHTDLRQPNAIYSMSRTYQTKDVQGLHFALVGTFRLSDHRVLYLGSAIQ